MTEQYLIEIGGVEQFLYVVAKDYEKPLLLMVHGGPGFSMIPLSQMYANLSSEYIIVYWDQRGTGKSYDDETITAESMNVSQFEQDCKEVLEWLIETYNKEAVYLLGHSWGSYIGIRVAYKYPELIKGYIAISQIVNYMESIEQGYEFVENSITIQGDEDALDQLRLIGKPPYESPVSSASYISQRVSEHGGAFHKKINIVELLDSAPTEVKLDIDLINRGMGFSAQTLIDEIVNIDVVAQGINELSMPVLFICGLNDQLVPENLTEAFYMQLDAPYKEYITFEESAHFPHIEETDKFMDTLLKFKEIVELAY